MNFFTGIIIGIALAIAIYYSPLGQIYRLIDGAWK